MSTPWRPERPSRRGQGGESRARGR